MPLYLSGKKAGVNEFMNFLSFLIYQNAFSVFFFSVGQQGLDAYVVWESTITVKQAMRISSVEKEYHKMSSLKIVSAMVQQIFGFEFD